MRVVAIAWIVVAGAASSTALAQTPPADPASVASAASAPAVPYAGRLAARIHANLLLKDPVPGNPVAEVEIRPGPDGTILARRLLKSSGSRVWDDAVLEAVDRTGKLPLDANGHIPPVIVLDYARR